MKPTGSSLRYGTGEGWSRRPVALKSACLHTCMYVTYIRRRVGYLFFLKYDTWKIIIIIVLRESQVPNTLLSSTTAKQVMTASGPSAISVGAQNVSTPQ